MLITLSAVVFVVNSSQEDSSEVSSSLWDQMEELVAPEKGARNVWGWGPVNIGSGNGRVGNINGVHAGSVWGPTNIGSHNGVVGDISNVWAGRRLDTETDDRRRQVSVGSGNGRVGNIRGVNVRGGPGVSVGSNNWQAGNIRGVNVGPSSWGPTNIGSHNGFVGDISGVWAGRRLDTEIDNRRRQAKRSWYKIFHDVETCPWGYSEITDAYTCKTAFTQLGKVMPARGLQVCNRCAASRWATSGWRYVPNGCSYQTQGDQAPHLSIGMNPDKVYEGKRNYSLICKVTWNGRRRAALAVEEVPEIVAEDADDLDVEDVEELAEQ